MSDTVFIRQGNMIKPVAKTPNTAQETLAPGVYVPTLTPEGELFLEIVKEKYDLPKHIFGDALDNAKTIFETYAVDRKDLPTGVLLSGKKGAGKSLLAEVLGQTAINNNVPVVELRSKLPGNIIRRICDMCSPMVLYIDEIDRLYKNDYERSDMDGLVATIGASSTKNVLTIVTTNKKASLPDAFIDRPTRFMFAIDYSYIAKNVVEEMVKMNGLSDKDLKYLLRLRHSLTYDVLNTYIHLFKKLGSSAEFDLVKHMYNLPTKDSIDVQLLGAAFGEDKILNARNISVSGTIVEYHDKDGSHIADLTEFFSGDYPSGTYSYKTPNGQLRLLLKVSDHIDMYNDRLDLKYDHRASIRDIKDFNKRFDITTYSENKPSEKDDKESD